MDRCSIPRLKSFGAWSEQTSSSGKRYYYNKETEVSQWEKPSEWREAEKKMERTPQKRPLNSGTENAKLGTGNISTVPSNTVTKLAVNNSTSQRNSSSTTGSGHNTPSQVHNSSKASNRVAHDSSTHSSSNNARTTERHRTDTSTKSLSNSHSHAKNGGGSHGASNSPSLRTAAAASPNSVKPLSAVKVAPVLKAVPAAQSSPNATRSPAPFPTSVKSESASALKSSPKDSTGGGTKRKTSTPSNGSLSGLPAPIIVTRIGFPTTGFAATTHSSPTTTSAPPKASPPSAVSANATTCAPSTSAPTPPTITTTAKPLLAGLNGRNGQGHHLAGVKSEDRPNEASAPEGPPLKQAKRTLEHYEAVHASLPSTSSFVALEARYAKYYRPDLISFRRNWSGDQHLDNARRFADRVHKQKLQLASIDNEITSVKSLVRTAEVRTELTTQKACFLREQLEALETRPAVPTAFLTQPSGSSVASYSANVT